MFNLMTKVCVTGRIKCFVCKAVNSEATVRCTDQLCHQVYHVTCLRSFLPPDEAADEQAFVCPLHQCATCQAIGKTAFAGL